MKKFIVFTSFLLASSISWAHGHGHHVHHSGYNWAAPLIIGGIGGYVIARSYPQTVVIERQPVVIQQQPVYTAPINNCSEWREVMDANGNITRERTCRQ